MMAENRVKHKGAYGPTGVLPKGTHMDSPRNFDLNRLANKKQKPFRGKNTSKYGASPFILEHFGPGKKPTKAKSQRTKVPDAPFKLQRKPKTGAIEEVKEVVKMLPKKAVVKEVAKIYPTEKVDTRAKYGDYAAKRRAEMLKQMAEEDARGSGKHGGAKHWEFEEGRHNLLTDDEIAHLHDLGYIDDTLDEMLDNGEAEYKEDTPEGAPLYLLKDWSRPWLDEAEMVYMINTGRIIDEDNHLIYDKDYDRYLVWEFMNKAQQNKYKNDAIPVSEFLEEHDPEHDIKEPVSSPEDSSEEEKHGKGRLCGGKKLKYYNGPIYDNGDYNFSDDLGHTLDYDEVANKWYLPKPPHDPPTLSTDSNGVIQSDSMTPQSYSGKTGPGYTEPAYDSAGNILWDLYDTYNNVQTAYNVGTGLYDIVTAESLESFGAAALDLAWEALPFLFGLGDKGKKMPLKKGSGKGKKVTEAFAKGMAFAKHYVKQRK